MGGCYKHVTILKIITCFNHVALKHSQKNLKRSISSIGLKKCTWVTSFYELQRLKEVSLHFKTWHTCS